MSDAVVTLGLLAAASWFGWLGYRMLTDLINSANVDYLGDDSRCDCREEDEE